MPLVALPVAALAVPRFAAFAITASTTSAATAPAAPASAFISVFVNVATVISRGFRVVAVAAFSANFDDFGLVAVFIVDPGC